MINPNLPVLLSIPHGGTQVPDEVMDECRLDLEAILRDGDTWTRHLFCLEEKETTAYIDTPIARAVVDMNRNPQDRGNPDGVVKTVTVDGSPVWHNPRRLAPETAELLVNAYHRPYHQEITRLCASEKILLGLDCHTMLPTSPVDNKPRPLVCLSNRGDSDGEWAGEDLTASGVLIRSLQQALAWEFRDDPRFVLENQPILLNDPFRGGYIIKNHGHGIPWIQVEFNRSLYMSDEKLTLWPDRRALNSLQSLGSGLLRAVRAVL